MLIAIGVTSYGFLDRNPLKETGKLVATGHRDGRLVAAVAFDDPRGLLPYRKQLAALSASAAS